MGFLAALDHQNFLILGFSGDWRFGWGWFVIRHEIFRLKSCFFDDQFAQVTAGDRYLARATTSNEGPPSYSDILQRDFPLANPWCQVKVAVNFHIGKHRPGVLMTQLPSTSPL